MKTRGSLIARSFLKSSSFINKKGKHPPMLYLMRWNKIVENKEELNDDNWLYVGEEDKDLISNQIFNLFIHNDGLPITKP